MKIDQAVYPRFANDRLAVVTNPIDGLLGPLGDENGGQGLRLLMLDVQTVAKSESSVSAYRGAQLRSSCGSIASKSLSIAVGKGSSPGDDEDATRQIVKAKHFELLALIRRSSVSIDNTRPQQ